MFERPLRLRKPGLFITGTDTGVGKTVIACAIAAALRHQWCEQPERAGPCRPGPAHPPARFGVCKPVATGCRRDREGLVSEDAEALAHFADCRQPLDVINPVRYVPPVAPAVAAELTGRPVDFASIARSLTVLDETSDCLLIEGIGGLLVPLGEKREVRSQKTEDRRQKTEDRRQETGDRSQGSTTSARKPRDESSSPWGSGVPATNRCYTVLDLVVTLGYPVLIVARAALGTLNHTAMTARLLEQSGCRVAGIAINGFVTDSSTSPDRATDLAMSTNRPWLMKLTGLPILATVPAVSRPGAPDQVAPQRGLIPPPILESVALTYWPDILCPPQHATPPGGGG